MHPLLQKIFDDKKFTNARNEIVEVHSETSMEQCIFLQDIITRHKYKRSIEIGLAFGISSLAIAEVISRHGGRHLAIDKFQHEVWKNNGIDLILLAGLKSSFDFIEKFSYQVLPDLLARGEKFDFVYIDSTKQFDWLMVDFFYLDKLLQLNGMIVFDDVTWPGIRKLLRLLSQFPSYQVYATLPENAPTPKPRTLVKWLLRNKKTKMFLKEELQQTDFHLGINTHCVALQKISEDTRNWDWHVNF